MLRLKQVLHHIYLLVILKRWTFFVILGFFLMKSNQCNAGLEQIEMKVYDWGEK